MFYFGVMALYIFHILFPIWRVYVYRSWQSIYQFKVQIFSTNHIVIVKNKTRAITIEKNVKVLTSFDDVTIVLKKFEDAQRIALAPSFNLIYWLSRSTDIYPLYNEKCKTCKRGARGLVVRR